jgi:hypothetical protein
MKTIKQGTIKRIVVNRHKIRAGHKQPLSIQTSKGPIPAREVYIGGASSVFYMPDKPLKCGARVWIYTEAAVTYE